MSGICGWIGAPKNPADKRALIDAMSAELIRFGPPERKTALAPDGAVAAAGADSLSSVATLDDMVVATIGTPKFEGDELAELARAQGNAAALAVAFRRSGTGTFTSIHGHFAAAIVDSRAGACTLVVDRMGVYALRYRAAGASFMFASNAACLRHHSQAQLDIDPQALYDYVYFHAIAGPRTVYRNVQRLMPGAWVTFKDGQCEVGHYWKMRFEEHERGSLADLKRQFLESLRHGVERSLTGGTVGAFLSGGTDSSTVAGVLGQVTGESARTYSIGFDAAGYDEIEYARITAKHFKTRHREYYVNADDIVRAVPDIAAIHDEPFGNASAVPAYYCAKLAREDGITRLLAGDGGDELFGGNERYGKQYVFSLYEKAPTWLRSHVIRPMLNGSAIVESLPFLRKARSYVQQASVPMPARLQTYNLVDRLGAKRIFLDTFLSGVQTNAPHRHLDALYHGAHADSLINHMLALDLQITLADNDLPKVSRSCELAGIEVGYPLLDDEVVDFSARLAPELKLKGTRLRYFFKESLRGFLPEATIAKKKHGFGLPFGLWLNSNPNLKALAYDSLADVRKRDIVRPEFLNELTDQRVSEHASYYGSLVWVFMMLEQWFKTHVDRRVEP